MLVRKTYKVSLYPNKIQEEELLKILAGCRFVWNHFLELRKNHYLEQKKTLPYLEMSRQLTQLRKTAPELAGLQILPLQQELRRLDKAYNSFFRKQNRFPKYKDEYRNKQSFQKTKDWKVIDRKIRVQPNLIVKFRGLFPAENEKTRMLFVSYVAGRWYASLLVEAEQKFPKKNSAPIGIDVGLTSLATVSNGKKYQIKKHDLQKNLTILQRRLARQTIGSKRIEQTRLAIARLHGRIANVRLDNIHKTTDEILKKNPSLVAVETLGVSNMLKNHRLARSIAHASWGEFLRQIRYKTEWRGGKVVQIDRFFPSSRTCHKCFYVADSLPLSIREWDCPQCGTHLDRDINAAKVILQQGQGMPRVEGLKSSRRSATLV